MRLISVIWLNYNSIHFIEEAKKSLESIFHLDYEPLEVIVVDNASTDGSDVEIQHLLTKQKTKWKFIKNDKNTGYAGGMNKGFEAVSEDSEYVIFVTNDVIAEPHGVKYAVEILEADTSLACVQGYLLQPGGHIYSAGNWIDDLMGAGGICQGLKPSDCATLNKEHYVTYLDGAMLLCKKRIIKEVMGRPFVEETFAYLDDNILGLRLWNSGYKLLYIPVNFGIHLVSKTFGKRAEYYGLRSRLARMYAIRPCSTLTFVKLKYETGKYFYGSLRRSLEEAKRVAKAIISQMGVLYLKKAPHVHLTNIQTLSFGVPWVRTIIRNIKKERGPITHEDLIELTLMDKN
ncbi:MAG: glycosyltransferase family 2 protein [Pyrobaculum sp.]